MNTPRDVIEAARAAAKALEDVVTPEDLAPVATSGDYADLSGTPTLGTAASADTGDFATAAQGTLAASAVQPGDLSTVATSGDYADLSGTPTLGTAAAQDQAAAVADSVAAPDVETLEAKVNELLGSLRAAGLIAS